MDIQSGEQVLEMMRGYQVSCVIAAAVDLELFDQLLAGSRTASELALAMKCDARGTTILLDALTALGFLHKAGESYRLAEQVAPLLSKKSPQSVIPMLRHQAVCMRRWSRIPWTVRAGSHEDVGPSVCGEEADQEAFIQAMHVVSRDVAPWLIPEINPGWFYMCTGHRWCFGVLVLGLAEGGTAVAWHYL